MILNEFDFFKCENAKDIMLKLKAEAFFKFMKMTGLEMSVNTGGQNYVEYETRKIEKTPEGFYKWDTGEAESIYFMDSAVFLKTVKETEDSLKLKLFI
jgi:hypothetical protein